MATTSQVGRSLSSYYSSQSNRQTNEFRQKTNGKIFNMHTHRRFSGVSSRSRATFRNSLAQDVLAHRDKITLVSRTRMYTHLVSLFGCAVWPVCFGRQLLLGYKSHARNNHVRAGSFSQQAESVYSPVTCKGEKNHRAQCLRLREERKRRGLKDCTHGHKFFV